MMPTRAAPADEGFSLVEVLISIAIMGLAVTAVLGAFATQVAGGRAHRDQSNASTVVTTVAEAVKAATYNATCDAVASQAAYRAAAQSIALPSDWVAKGWSTTNAVEVSQPRYWTGTGFGATCNDTSAVDTARLFRVQQVNVTVTGPAGDTQTLTVTKTGPL